MNSENISRGSEFQRYITYRVLQNTLPFGFVNFVFSCLSCAWMWPCHIASLWLQLSTVAPPVSLELHERIVVWRYELNIPIDAIVQLSGHSKWTVNYVLSAFHDYNQVINQLTRPQGQPRLLDRDDLNFIDSILAAEPGLYLDEIQEKLFGFRDIEVSISTISRTLSRLDQTHKGIAKEAIERNELLRATWQIEMAQYDPRQLVFIDKAGINDHTNIWRKGWSSRGQECVRMSVVVMDNCSIHHNEDIRTAIGQECGMIQKLVL